MKLSPLIILLLFSSLNFFSCKNQLRLFSKGEQSSFELTILHVNDVYEIAALEGGKTGGMARVATIEKKLRAQNPNTYTILSGDFVSPSVIGTVKIDGERVQGKQMVEMMNAVGVDWVVFGNHEFDIKEGALLSRINESEFGWIAGNVKHVSNGDTLDFMQHGQPLPTETIWKFPLDNGDSLRLGVIGVCLKANLQDFVHYEDIYESATAAYTRLKDKTDALIAITHLSIEEDRELARRIPELQLIMGGHEHENHIETVGSTVIAKADANAKSAYIHQLTWNGKKLNIGSELKKLDESIEPDAAVAELVQVWQKKAEDAFAAEGLNLSEPVATLAEPLDGLEKDIRTKQTNLGLAICTAMYQAAKNADLAIVNGGSVRIDDYLKGEITEYDLVRAMPFGGKVLKVDMKGSLLKQVLDAGLSNKGNGGYLQWYKVGHESNSWQIGGQPLDENKVYRVAMNDFLMLGLESNMGFLTRDNPGVQAVIEPAANESLRDIRMVLAEYLKKQ